MNLKLFPLDRQTCSLSMVSCKSITKLLTRPVLALWIYLHLPLFHVLRPFPLLCQEFFFLLLSASLMSCETMVVCLVVSEWPAVWLDVSISVRRNNTTTVTSVVSISLMAGAVGRGAAATGTPLEEAVAAQNDVFWDAASPLQLLYGLPLRTLLLASECSQSFRPKIDWSALSLHPTCRRVMERGSFPVFIGSFSMAVCH